MRGLRHNFNTEGATLPPPMPGNCIGLTRLSSVMRALWRIVELARQSLASMIHHCVPYACRSPKGPTIKQRAMVLNGSPTCPWGNRRLIAFIVLGDDLAFCAWQRALDHVPGWLQSLSLDCSV